MGSFKDYMKLSWIKYTDKVVGGDSMFFRIRINPKYNKDDGLLAHELEHVRHWYTTTLSSLTVSVIMLYMCYPELLLAPTAWAFLIFYNSLVYNFLTTVSKKARFKAESMCFAVQLSQYPKRHFETYLNQLSMLLAEEYDLGITKEEARKSILKEYQNIDKS